MLPISFMQRRQKVEWFSLALLLAVLAYLVLATFFSFTTDIFSGQLFLYEALLYYPLNQPLFMLGFLCIFLNNIVILLIGEKLKQRGREPLKYVGIICFGVLVSFFVLCWIFAATMPFLPDPFWETVLATMYRGAMIFASIYGLMLLFLPLLVTNTLAAILLLYLLRQDAKTFRYTLYFLAGMIGVVFIIAISGSLTCGDPDVRSEDFTCFARKAARTDNPGLCKQLDDSLASPSPGDLCRQHYAILKEDPSLCAQFDPDGRVSCTMNVANALPGDCISLSSGVEKAGAVLVNACSTWADGRIGTRTYACQRGMVVAGGNLCEDTCEGGRCI